MKLRTILFVTTITFCIESLAWNPSDAQLDSADSAFRKFMALINDGEFKQAYDLQTQSMRELVTFEKWRGYQQEFEEAAGGKQELFDLKATWYKDPPDAHGPGIYVAFDYSCRYEKIDICSGLVILHSLSGVDFSVMRMERNYIDKKTEEKLREQGKLPANK